MHAGRDCQLETTVAVGRDEWNCREAVGLRARKVHIASCRSIPAPRLAPHLEHRADAVLGVLADRMPAAAGELDLGGQRWEVSKRSQRREVSSRLSAVRVPACEVISDTQSVGSTVTSVDP
eukprot:365317-Chlamydomonas_euryale.AAC.4